jgi:hypothetical protein
MGAHTIGYLLPGIIKVEEIIQIHTAAQTTWRVTLVAQLGSEGELPLLEATVQFVTSDRMLVKQLRERKLRYALDLLQLNVETEDQGLLDIVHRDDEHQHPAPAS